MRIRILCIIIGATVLLTPGVAEAKGPGSATIEGDGIATPITIDGHSSPPGLFFDLVEQSGFFPAVFTQRPSPMLAAKPTSRLGRELVVTWELGGGIQQEVYPDAEGGPLTYMAPGEREGSRGGWYRAPATLGETLRRLGVPDAPVAPVVVEVASAQAATPRTTSTGGGAFPWAVVVSAVAAMVAFAGAGAVSSRRRRDSRPSPT